jgi:hypothetical protein
MYKRYFVVSIVGLGLLCLESDSAYFEPVKLLEPITATQIAESCSPSKIINLDNINVSTGTHWSLGHSYHCLGRPHVITTLNRIGLLPVDKLVSEAIVLNYVWVMNQTKAFSCSASVEKVNSIVLEDDARVLFSPYVLRCQDL